MVGLVTLDLVLRFILAGVSGVAFEFGLRGDDFDYLAGDAAGFRVPSHVIANCESSFHQQIYP